MTTTYNHSVDGEMIGETTGGTRTDYVCDALGSVVGTIVSDVVENTYRYAPYGEHASASGGGDHPSFRWNGVHGYRSDDTRHAEKYVRARHYGSTTGSWTSIDPYWPVESPYGYVYGRPTNVIDPTGLGSLMPPREPRRPILSCDPDNNDAIFAFCWWCSKQSLSHNCHFDCNFYANWYYENCPRVGKPPRHPIPGERWGPGNGGIVPKPPRPRPSISETICNLPPCESASRIGECRTFGWGGPIPPGVIPPLPVKPQVPGFDPYNCSACCSQLFGRSRDPLCLGRLSDCLETCGESKEAAVEAIYLKIARVLLGAFGSAGMPGPSGPTYPTNPPTVTYDKITR